MVLNSYYAHLYYIPVHICAYIQYCMVTILMNICVNFFASIKDYIMV